VSEVINGAREEQAHAIHRLAREGWSEYAISHAIELAIEQVRHVLGDAVPPDPNAASSD
jgi:hypothetical protein